MFKFPNVLPTINPLYPTNEPVTAKHQVLRKQRSLELRRNNTVAPITRCHSEDVSRSNTAHVCPDVEHFDYNLSVKIANNSKMYEPVANSCVTILTRYNDQEYVSPQNVEDPYRKEIKNNDNKLKASAIPEKPPRRIKLQKLNQNKKIEETTVIVENKMKEIEDHRVDLDDINKLSVETDRNYKNRFLSVGVQVSPLPPYRLRILPKGLKKVKGDPEKCDCGKDRAKICCAVVIRWMFSQCGLTVIIIIWALLGAAAFYNTEGPREQEQAEELSTFQNNLAMNLATELRQVVPHEPVWLSMVQKYFAKHESLLLNAVSAGYGEGGGGGHIWTYPGCVLFAVSLLTTLGFGAPVPRTTLGRGAAVLFSAVGIPLHFLLILNIGVLIASKLQIWAMQLSNKQLNSPSTNSITSNSFYSKQPTWLKWLPIAAIICYYLLGVILFGFVRQRNFADSLLFPLDFTATGGVAKTLGYVRILYALYLEVAVTLAATMVSLLQVSASRGILNLGLKLGLLTNT